jgi:hypothetical protein
MQTEAAYNQALADGNDLLAKELKEQLDVYTEKEQESF